MYSSSSRRFLSKYHCEYVIAHICLSRVSCIVCMRTTLVCTHKVYNRLHAKDKGELRAVDWSMHDDDSKQKPSRPRRTGCFLSNRIFSGSRASLLLRTPNAIVPGFIIYEWNVSAFNSSTDEHDKITTLIEAQDTGWSIPTRDFLPVTSHNMHSPVCKISRSPIKVAPLFPQFQTLVCGWKQNHRRW